MHPNHCIIFLFYIQIVFGETSTPHRVDLSSFCGYQHTDDYNRESNVTSIDEFPWIAALIYKFNSDGAQAVLCSGALINRRYILTAAQCLILPQGSVLIAVRLGEYNIKNETDCVITSQFGEDCAKATDFGIEEKLVHPDYNPKKSANDIALLRIDKQINEFSDFIRPICLIPTRGVYAKIGDILYTSGWGRQFSKGKPAEIKKKVGTVLITNEECSNEFTSQVVTENNICTKDLPTNTEFTCQGDAGGPVMFVLGSVPQWHLEGISSWGAQCGFELPLVHTRVSKYLDWIQNNMRD